MAERGFVMEDSSADGGLVRVTGEVDASSSGELAAVLDRLIDARPSAVAVDMAGVTFIDSSGLKVLVTAQRRLVETGGELRVIHLSPAVDRLLTLCGLHSVLGVSGAGAPRSTEPA